MFLCSMLLTGCSVVQNKEKLLTLKALGQEQENLTKYIEKRDAQFDRLLESIKDGSIEDFKTKKDFVMRFGNPILEREDMRADIAVTTLLYRYQMERFDTEKVYLYFNHNQHLIDWEHFIPNKGE
jgi:hypothetical protein